MNSSDRMSLVSSLGLVLFLIATITGFTLLMQSNRVWEALCESVGVYNERCVILFGDSLMAQFSMASNFGWTPYKNRSVSGRRAVTALADLIKVLPEATDVVFLLGTNDLGTDVSPEELVFAMARLGRAAQAFGCGVVVCSLLPVSGEHLATRSPEVLAYVNGMLRQMCVRNGFNFLDVYTQFAKRNGSLDSRFSTDGLHLNWKGRHLLGAAVKKAGMREGS
jgi:lysophospholipase L1-like esterase